MKNQSKLLIVSLILASFISCARNSKSTEQPAPPKPFIDDSVIIVSNPQNLVNSESAMKKPYVLMISIDGFRYDYLERYSPPNLLKIAKSGIKAQSLKPSFPTLTFPNHITLVTGLYPEHHGIVGNTFYDEKLKEKYSAFGSSANADQSKWYSGDTVWTLAAKNEMLSGVYFWVGSEANISGRDPTYFAKYKDGAPSMERVKQIINWLELPAEKRPHFLGLYFSDVDTKGHKFGPETAEVKSAVLEIDKAIGFLNDYIEANKLPVNIVVVSDHGMLELDPQKVVSIADITSTAGFQIADRGPCFMMYSDDQEKIDKAYADLKAKEDSTYKVYLRNDVPAELNFVNQDRTGDIVVIAEPPYYITDKSFSAGPATSSKATHGWRNSELKMHGLFIAKGPQIKKGKIISTVNNVDVAPFVMKLLDLPVPDGLDGSADKYLPLLKN